MNTLAAHDLVTIVNCKVAGCSQEAISARGRYARLCEEHRRAARVDHSIAAAAQRVFLAASELDLALKRRHGAPAAAVEAIELFKEELNRLHSTARSALA